MNKQEAEAFEEMELWRDVVVASLRAGKPLQISIFEADDAVKAFKERFGPKPRTARKTSALFRKRGEE